MECVQWLVKNTSPGRDKLNSKEADRQRSLLHTASKYGQVRTNKRLYKSTPTISPQGRMLAPRQCPLPTQIRRVRARMQYTSNNEAYSWKEPNECNFQGAREELNKLAFTTVALSTFLLSYSSSFPSISGPPYL